MHARSIISPTESLPEDDDGVSATAVREQLQRLLKSHYFRHSKRYPRLLQHVVEETLNSRTDSLKERLIGMAVFGRAGDYDSNADPIVRVTAGEVRKRLAQYYQEPGHEIELRIEIALGSYIATFGAPHTSFNRDLTPKNLGEPAKSFVLHDKTDAGPISQPEESAGSHCFTNNVGTYSVDPESWLERPTGSLISDIAPHAEGMPSSNVESSIDDIESDALSRTYMSGKLGQHKTFRSGLVRLAATASLALVALCGAYFVDHRMIRKRPVTAASKTSFWHPLLDTREPITIVLGVHSFDGAGHDLPAVIGSDGEASSLNMLTAMLRTDMVPITDVSALNQMTALMTSAGRPLRLVSSAHVGLKQLRDGPVLLVGGLDNAWTLRLTAGLRFHFVNSDTRQGVIVDAEHSDKKWAFDNLQAMSGSSHDYALVVSYHDVLLDQPVILVAGIGMAGTLAAAEFTTRGNYLQTALQQAGAHAGQNVEFVIGTEILNDEPAPPHVMASNVF